MDLPFIQPNIMSATGPLSEFQLSAAERLELPGSFQNGAATQPMAGTEPMHDPTAPLAFTKLRSCETAEPSPLVRSLNRNLLNFI